MKQVVLATRNAGKIAEFSRLLSEHAQDIQVLGLADFPDMPDVEESGTTLTENALLKSRAVAAFTQLPALASCLFALAAVERFPHLHARCPNG